MAKGVSFLVVFFAMWIGANADCCEEPEPCPSCPSRWTEYDDRCFHYFFDKKSWADAEKHCLSEGGNLVSYHNQKEYDFVLRLIRRSSGGNTRIWTGAQDATKNGVWLWCDGTKFNYVNWGIHQPDNAGNKEHCMELNWKGAPNDHQCHIAKPFMCVKAME